MQVTVTQNSDFCEVTIAGRIDATTAGDLEGAVMQDLGKAHKALLLDFAQVEYISSAGLRAVLKIAKAAQIKKLQLRCFALQPAVKEVFTLSGFSSFLNIQSDREAALASIK